VGTEGSFPQCEAVRARNSFTLGIRGAILPIPIRLHGVCLIKKSIRLRDLVLN